MKNKEKTDTIFALSSGRGRSGVAVVRISGHEAGTALQSLAGTLPSPRKAVVRPVKDPQSGELLDTALVLFFPGPSSFTGEDVSELHIHGGSAVLEGVLDALAKLKGLRGAEPGEFARRAFENAKLDLTEAEGLADLIDAETKAQRRQALRQSAGALREMGEQWREQIIHAASLVEAALDFSDEADVPELIDKQARPIVEELANSISGHLKSSGRGERLRDGLQVVLAGAPNAGKSSLLNALSRRDAAIVSDEPGTTRDVIEVHLDLDGWPVTLIDTAGLREAEGKIEQEGIRRTLERAEKADLVLWLVDAEDPVWEPAKGIGAREAAVITVLNKTDLAQPKAKKGVIPISVKTGRGLDALLNHLTGKAAEYLDAGEPAIVTRARQRRELETCHQALQNFLQGDPDQLELRAEDLRSAGTALGRLSGRVDVEDVLDRIFGDFCIGK